MKQAFQRTTSAGEEKKINMKLSEKFKRRGGNSFKHKLTGSSSNGTKPSASLGSKKKKMKMITGIMSESKLGSTSGSSINTVGSISTGGSKKFKKRASHVSLTSKVDSPAVRSEMSESKLGSAFGSSVNTVGSISTGGSKKFKKRASRVSPTSKVDAPAVRSEMSESKLGNASGSSISTVGSKKFKKRAIQVRPKATVDAGAASSETRVHLSRRQKRQLKLMREGTSDPKALASKQSKEEYRKMAKPLTAEKISKKLNRPHVQDFDLKTGSNIKTPLKIKKIAKLLKMQNGREAGKPNPQGTEQNVSQKQSKKVIKRKRLLEKLRKQSSVSGSETIVDNKSKELLKRSVVSKLGKKVARKTPKQDSKPVEESGASIPETDDQKSSETLSRKNQTPKRRKKKALKKSQGVVSIDTSLEDTKLNNSMLKKKLKNVVLSSGVKVTSNADSMLLTKVGKKKKKLQALLNEADNTISARKDADKNTLFNLKKKRLQDKNQTTSNIGLPSLKDQMSDQLKASRFRWLNEQLYTSSSSEASKYFKDDPQAFDAYHDGYRKQITQWPLNPLDWIIKSIESSPPGTVIADMGCGEAQLAESLPQFKVHSFDLVASKPGVVACDMAHSPLLMESVDIVVFCLSLMGTNLRDFILEANRVLKVGGILKIAEVESRFEDVDNFTSELLQYGFQLKRKDYSKEMFYFMDFKKTRRVSNNGKLPIVKLDPCLYKKR